MERIFQEPKNSRTLVALSGMMAEQADIRNRLNKVMEVIPVQHQYQVKTVPELHTFHPTIWLRMLEDN